MPLKGFAVNTDLLHYMFSEGLAEALGLREKKDEQEREGQWKNIMSMLRNGLSEIETEKEEEEKQKLPVVVIGCGASGIACLSKLAEAGIEAIGLEASDRIGGRIRTEEYGNSVLDLGAAWCHGERNNLVYELAEPHNLLGRPEWSGPEADWFILSDGSIIPNGNATEAFKAIQDAVDRSNKNNTQSISEFVKNGVKNNDINTTATAPQTYQQPITDAFVEWYERENHLGGERNPLTTKSLHGLKKHEPCRGEFWLHWKGKGYKTILDVLLRKYPDPSQELKVNIQYNKAVVNVAWQVPNPDPNDPQPVVLVACSDGSMITARKVVVTVSLGVLKNRYMSMFIPPLPADKISAINNLQFCVLDKIYIEFDSAWWPEDINSFKIIWREEDKAKFEENEKWVTGIYGLRTVEHQPNMLLAWLYGVHAESMEEVDWHSVKKGVTKLLNIFRLNFDVTPVRNIKRSTWANNEYIRGSYSYRAVSTEQANTGAEDLAKPLVFQGTEVVAFAGEATSHRWHNAVHGAIDAGFREANRIIQSQ